MKNCDSCLISTQNLDCGTTKNNLDCGTFKNNLDCGITKNNLDCGYMYHNLCLREEITKLMYTTVNSSSPIYFLWGYKLHEYVSMI